MDDGTALLAAIAAHPDEDNPRLAYADWLDEHNRPVQAEFIRLQCDIARRRSYGPAYPPDAKDQAREEELRERMIDALGPEIAKIVREQPRRISFSRGFIKNLNLYGSKITALPEGLYVMGNLDLMETPITRLPEELRVGGNLDLERTRITGLPEGLHVGGNLDLRWSRIAALPEGLQVRGNLDLDGCRITRLPEDLRVGGSLFLYETTITSLPESLEIGDDPDLYRTRINPAAARRIPDMPGLSRQAKIIGLRSAGFEHLAAEVESQPAQRHPSGSQTNPNEPMAKRRTPIEPFDGMDPSPNKSTKQNRER